MDRERLLQEDYVGAPHGPWKVLVICQCLNRASWTQVEPALKKLFEVCPSPKDCPVKSIDAAFRDRPGYVAMYEVLRPLGFGHTRVWRLVNMCENYLVAEGCCEKDYASYPVRLFVGCSDYARDAWDLFVLKKSCAPEDKHLRRYAKRVGLLSEVTLCESVTRSKRKMRIKRSLNTSVKMGV